jgi:hypothetical protein
MPGEYKYGRNIEGPHVTMSLNDTLPPLQDLHPQNNVLSSFSYIAIGLVATWILYRYLTLTIEKDGIRKLGGFPIFTAWTFFTKRYDFIWANFGSDPRPHFKFNVLQVGPFFFYGIGFGRLTNYMQHNVIALRGEESRKAYFDNKSLSFIEGYKVLMGGVRPTSIYH